jgi:hypothetical protein
MHRSWWARREVTPRSAAGETRFRFEVTTERAEVAAFAQSLGLAEASDLELRIPLTYPVRWLSADDVQGWLVAALGGTSLPVHEMQDFTYRAPLALDRAYTLDVTCAVSGLDTPRITIMAEIWDGDELIGSTRSSILAAPHGAS